MFKIDGMCCADEVADLKRVLTGKEDLLNFDFINEKLTVEKVEGSPTEAAVIKAVKETGMKAIP